MAIVGPLTSLVLGAGLVVLASLTAGPLEALVTSPQQIVSALGPLTTLLGWLGSVNFTVGLFNLIPGFPLDGGRVLRSLLWAATDNLRRATRWASWAGQGIAWLMIVAGIAMVFGASIPVLGSGVGNGLWLAFIGWFLHGSAVASYRQVVIQDILEGVPVERMMRADPPSVLPDINVDELVNDGIMGTDDHTFPVMEEGHLVGLVTLEDVRGVPRTTWAETSVRQIMTPADQLVSVNPEEDAAEALNQLQARDVRQLPVLRNGSLAGLLRRRDIIRWLQLHSELELT
jgi:CBS domain-containing protein